MLLVPAFIDLKDKKILVVGGGKVATRKVQKLLPHPLSCRLISTLGGLCCFVKVLKSGVD
jgi:precorrin-2 dehydrogenase (EC 1.3.1.76)